MKFTIEQRVELFKKFYARQNDRPLFGFFVESEYPLHRYPSSKKLPENTPLRPEDFCVDDYVQDSINLFEKHEACVGDFIWSGSAFWGIPWVEAALGCPISADHSTGSIHAQKPLTLTLPDGLPKFDAAAPWLQKMDEFLVALSQAGAGRWPIGTTRMRGIADLLSLLYCGDNLIYALMEKAEQVHQVCEHLTNFWLKMAQFQIERIPLFHDGIGSFYYHMWAPPGTVWHQEDASALLSPALYDEFIRLCDERIADTLEHCIIHLHPSGFIPVEPLLEMNMLALELHVDQGGKSADQLYQWHKKILDRKPLLIWGHLTTEDLDYIFSKLPAKGLAVMTVVSGPDQAEKLWDKYITSC